MVAILQEELAPTDQTTSADFLQYGQQDEPAILDQEKRRSITLHKMGLTLTKNLQSGKRHMLLSRQARKQSRPQRVEWRPLLRHSDSLVCHLRRLFPSLRATSGDLRAYHLRLLEAYLAKRANGWASGPDDGYYFERLPYHLAEAGWRQDLAAFVLDPDGHNIEVVNHNRG